jgi:predicted RNase H-like HicB family nuclease
LDKKEYSDNIEFKGVVMSQPKKREFHVVIEKDEEFYIGSIPELKGCHTQAKSLDELMERIKEAAALCLEEYGQEYDGHEFVGVQKVAI